MSILELNTGNCQNCYRCIKQCQVKAIAFKEGRATILEKECVQCGSCVEVCPQNAQFIQNDVENVKQLIASGKKVYASIAPSWLGWYDTTDFSKISAALKKLGFAGVEETAIGAAETSREYQALIRNGEMKNIIVTACNSVVMLIEKHYPSLVKMLAPVSSPMMAHARLMRETYDDIKVVFIGPCLSKKSEVQDPLAGGLVNYALTFSNVDEWMRAEGVEIGEEDQEVTGLKNTAARLYPKPGGILKTIGDFGNYQAVAVDGFDRCVQTFNMLAEGEVTGLFVEANICMGGCIGGPIMRLANKKVILTETKITDKPLSHDKVVSRTAERQFPHPRVFANRMQQYEMPTEEQIQNILAKTGKFTKEDELDCGSCGYASCRDKAIAVFQGKADINMCMPFFREKAENMSNMVLEYSPNGIIAFDADYMVQELNPTAEELYQVLRSQTLGFPMEGYKEEEFEKVRRQQKPLVEKEELPHTGILAEKTLIYIKEHNMYLSFIKNINESEAQKKQLESMRDHTVEVAQQVIDKQMRVAQEIASLLGETTAETKVALTNLKKSMDSLSEM